MDKNVSFTVFTKPWRDISLEELCEKVKAMGFDGVEYPLRDGYQVQPSDGAAGIRRLCGTMREYGLTVGSIASGLDVRFSKEENKVSGMTESLFSSCGENGVPIIRICQGLNGEMGFHENVEAIHRTYDALLPYCEKYNVKIGVQMHFGMDISNSAEAYLLLHQYDPRYIAAVWDSGHSGLAGNEPQMALSLLWEHICMVNFKAAYYKRINGPEAAQAEFDAYWTTGPHACGSWEKAVRYLKEHDYRGTVCLPSEYSDEKNVDAYTVQDLKYIKSLFD